MVHCLHSRRAGKMSHHTQQCSNGNNLYDVYHGDSSGTTQRDPPPYPGHFRQLYNPGYRQSYSGSETSTDMSLSSSENLSLAVRQDPQGEENTQTLSCPLDCIESDANYSILSRLGMSVNPTSDVEVKSSNPGTFYVTGSPSRSSSTSPPQSDISDISSILQFIASTGGTSYSAVSPTGSCSSSGGSSIYSTASHYLQQQNTPMPLQQQLQYPPMQQHYPQIHLQQQQQHQQPSKQVTPEAPKKLQRPKSANVPLTKDVVRDLQQQASKFLEEQCQQYIQAQNQEQCIQQQLQQQHFQQQHFQQHPQQLQQQLFNGSQNQEPFMSTQLFSSSQFQDGLQNLQNGNKPNFLFNTNHGQQVSQANQVQPFANKVLYTTSTIQPMTINNTSIPQETCSKPESPSYAYCPPPFPLPPEGFCLNPVGKARHMYKRQSSNNSQKSGNRAQVPVDVPKTSPPKELYVKPIGETNSTKQTVIKQQQVPENNSVPDKSRNSNMPPEYPGVVAKDVSPPKETRQKELQRSFEMLGRLQNGLSQSQPDLTKLLDIEKMPKPLALSKTDLDLPKMSCSNIKPSCNLKSLKKSPEVTQPTTVWNDFSSPPRSELNHAVVATRATEMVERLSVENSSLRKELEGYYGKLSKLQKLEMEIKKISDAYDGLVKQTHKRENLEKMMRFKLDNDMKKFKHVNKELKEQLDRALCLLQKKDVYNVGDSDLRREITKKDSMIAKLLSQNKETTSAKERSDIETTAQRSTLQEQRTHIEILEKALNNAQASIIRLEEELRKKAIQDQKIEELQRAVTQLQLVAAKREALENRHRNKLEEEIRNLKEHHNLSISKNSDTDEGIASDCESSTGHHQGLLHQVREKDNRILALESELLKFEQRYLEESALRHLAMDAAAMPKDMRIAALEKSSVETEKVIAQTRSERLKHLEEVYQANRRAAELEAQVKSQAAQLAERDAMISVLQKHNTLGSRTSSVSSLLSSSPLHSPLATLSSPLSSPLSSLITSTVASIMSLSQSLPSSGTSSPKLQGTGISESSILKEVKSATHMKSGSLESSVSSNASVGPSTEALRELQQRIAEQAALLQSMQTGGDQLSKILWQV